MKAERVGSLIWMTIGLGFIFGSVRLGLGSLEKPGAGLLPFFAAGSLTFFSTIILFRSFGQGLGMQIKLSTFWEGTQWHRPLTIAFILLGYILCLESIGFILCSFSLVFFMLKGLGKFSWLKAGLIALMGTTCSYLIFYVFLGVMLPKGIL